MLSDICHYIYIYNHFTKGFRAVESDDEYSVVLILIPADTMRPCIELVWIIPAAYWVLVGPAAAGSSTSEFVSGVAGLD